VQDEAAFIHFREQIGFEEGEAKDGESDDRHGADDQNPGTLEKSAHRVGVELDDTAERAGEMRFFGGEKFCHVGVRRWLRHAGFGAILTTNEIMAQGWSPGERKQK